MKNGMTFILLIQAFISLAQMPESNLIFRLDYNQSFSINLGESSSFEYQGGFLSNDRYGEADQACTFEADKQQIIFEEFPCLDKEITISIWLKLESYQGDRYPIIQLVNNDEFILSQTRHFGLEVHNNRTSLGYYNETGGRIVYNQDSITYDNNWHHLLGTISELNLLKLYIDNEYIGYQDFSDGTFEGINQILIGGGYENLFGHMSIDDIRIYNRALERCEIEALFYEKDTIIDCEFVEETECSPIVSTNNIELQNTKIYPNPISGNILNIESHQNSTYQILNSVGQIITSGRTKDNTISIEGITPGIHFLQLDNIVHKIVIE